MAKNEGKGLEALVGQKVLLLCANYFYAGKLAQVGESSVELEDPVIVYETGAWDAKTWATAESLPAKRWNVCLSAIESYGIGK
jgi:hypothetical protein